MSTGDTLIRRRVRVIRQHGMATDGMLWELDARGAIVERDKPHREGNGRCFIPMHHIVEIIDLGR